MFDIGFSEILLIAVITLFVVGPDRLPETVRTVGLWLGRFKRSVREARRELELQIGADEIRRELHNEEVMRNLERLRQDVSETLNEKINVDEDDLYPPGHHDHDPNNNLVDELGNPIPNPATHRPSTSENAESDGAPAPSADNQQASATATENQSENASPADATSKQ